MVFIPKKLLISSSRLQHLVAQISHLDKLTLTRLRSDLKKRIIPNSPTMLLYKKVCTFEFHHRSYPNPATRISLNSGKINNFCYSHDDWFSSEIFSSVADRLFVEIAKLSRIAFLFDYAAPKWIVLCIYYVKHVWLF